MKYWKLLIIGALVLVAAIILGAVVGYWQKEKSFKEFRSDKISFKYPKDYTEQPKASPEKHSEAIIKLAVQEPLSIIELSKENGAIIAANTVKSPFLDALEKSAGKKLPLTYPDFKKLKSERIRISGRDASRVDFTYTGRDKKTTLYMSLFVIPSNNDAYYLNIQSVNKDHWEEDTKNIQSTIELN